MMKFLFIDRFTILLLVAVLLAMLFPIQGEAVERFSQLTTLAIAGLFFLHGAKLSREAVLQGMMHWRLHGLIFLGAVLDKV